MLESPPDALNEYLSSVFNQIIGRRLCKLYPLVFSSEYAKVSMIHSLLQVAFIHLLDSVSLKSRA